jgi:sulfotransferase
MRSARRCCRTSSIYYTDLPTGDLVFDTNRVWCARLRLLTELFSAAKVICGVRSVPRILDSIELLIRKNKFQPSGIFNFEPGGTVYSRVEGLAGNNGMVGFAWNALREAFCGGQAACPLALIDETLTTKPEQALAAVYEFIGEKPLNHDFKNIEFDAEEFEPPHRHAQDFTKSAAASTPTSAGISCLPS